METFRGETKQMNFCDQQEIPQTKFWIMMGFLVNILSLEKWVQCGIDTIQIAIL